MEEIPKFIMRCPKCLKEFSPDMLYCEACSAMLEPEEIGTARPAEKAGEGRADAGSPAPAESKEIQDTEVDHLKTDIEDRFVYALLFERDRLQERLSETEKSLDKLRIDDAGAQHPDTFLALEKEEREMGDILKRIAQLEATIDEVQRTVKSEIGDLDLLLHESERPGVFWFLNAQGRRYRMLLSQRKIKKILIDILSGEMSPSYFRARRRGSMYLLVVLSVILTLSISWQLFLYTHRGERVLSPLPATVQARVEEKGGVTKGDIIALLEDIKKANLNKDIGLWESRYSRQSVEFPGKRESVVEQWKNLDYRFLEYQVESITLGPEKASALVTWKMKLFSKKKNEGKTLSQRLAVDFIVEEGKLKIRSVTKQ